LHEPKRFPARQTLESCQALARLAGLPADRVVYAQQHPEAIDAGVFHNDVISVGTHTTFLHHEHAFLDTPAVLEELRAKLAGLPGSPPLAPIEVGAQELTYEEAAACYLFNSQLIATHDQDQPGLTLLAPTDTQDHPRAKAVADRIERESNTITRVEYADVRESMRNGGGPACLRLRVPITAPQLAAMHQGVLLTDELFETLAVWIDTHYRDELHPSQLADKSLAEESRAATAELAQILGLPSLYAI
ncbi:MAG: N-succinylarginine dihydrolase, partial [Planctomycetota bacterium]